MPTEPTACNWRRAYGSPLSSGSIKHCIQDFRVDESLGFAPDGQGEHDLLQVEKTDTNTIDVAAGLARYAGIAARDVGYCGLKDRRAVTRQWFSVRRPDGSGTEWENCQIKGARIIAHARHSRKLRRGAHKGNRFDITVRQLDKAHQPFDTRLKKIAEQGVPNYFGTQRFGRQNRNLDLARAAFAGKKMRKQQLGFAISAARAYVFNGILDARVARDNWRSAMQGEVINLDGSNSVFVADTLSAELDERIETLDVHPTIPLWGRGRLQSIADAAKFERTMADCYREWCDGLESIRANAGRRATRLAVRELNWRCQNQELHLTFWLRTGGYATSVLREIICD